MTTPGTPDGKLVRDLIPQIITASGRSPVARRLGPEERRSALLAKLAEEAAELASARDDEVIGELADLLEVVRALAAEAGLDWSAVERTAEAKAEERGAFREGWFLLSAGGGASGVGPVAAAEVGGAAEAEGGGGPGGGRGGPGWEGRRRGDGAGAAGRGGDRRGSGVPGGTGRSGASVD